MSRNHLILIPIPLLALAVFPMPYSYYAELRTIVCVAAAFLCERNYRTTKSWNGMALAYAGVALLFNPILPSELSRGSWFIFDIGAALLFYYSWMKSGEKKSDLPGNDSDGPERRIGK